MWLVNVIRLRQLTSMGSIKYIYLSIYCSVRPGVNLCIMGHLFVCLFVCLDWTFLAPVAHEAKYMKMFKLQECNRNEWSGLEQENYLKISSLNKSCLTCVNATFRSTLKWSYGQASDLDQARVSAPPGFRGLESCSQKRDFTDNVSVCDRSITQWSYTQPVTILYSKIVHWCQGG